MQRCKTTVNQEGVLNISKRIIRESDKRGYDIRDVTFLETFKLSPMLLYAYLSLSLSLAGG